MKKERIHKYYDNIAVEDLLIIYNYKNIMQLARFDQIILSTTSKKFLSEKKNIIDTFGGCFLLSGQKGILKKARKSVAGFKLRKGNIIGCMTTLRRQAMYVFLDKMITFAIPSFAFQAPSQPGIENDKLSNSEFRLRLKAFLSEKQAQLAKTLATSWRRTNKPVANAWKKQNVVFHKEKKHFNMGMKSFSVAKTFPEYEHFFSLFESIFGFNTVSFLSFPKTSEGATLREKCNYRLNLPFLQYNQTEIFTCKQSSFLLKSIEKEQSYSFCVPRQKISLFFTQFQCPSVYTV